MAYAKTSVDIGDTTILGGLSYAKGSSRLDHTQDETGAHAFSGDSILYGADLVVKHFFDSYSSLTWQSEWLSRNMDGTQYSIDDTTLLATPVALTKKQSGLYTQLVYAYDKNWKTGVRYDTIYQNDIEKSAGLPAFAPQNLDKYSAMVEYHTSEFARFRLQYDRNNALFNADDERQQVDTIMLQANISIGAHGAHSF